VIAGAWICLFAPLVGTLAITLAGTRISRRNAGWLSTASVAVAFAGAIWSFVALSQRDSFDRSQVWSAYTWLQAGSFKVGLSVLVDPLSTMMMLIVSGVGLLIVLYSVGYMDGDDEERRYFAYMSFFVFSMLLLVEGGNLLLLLVGWGLVGLSSYLLIGFWHERPEAVAAAKKAFVMNAIGDATMALAFFVIIAHAGSLDFVPAFNLVAGGGLSPTATNLVALGLLGGAVAKSAQIPLQTWLPDAMEGPTPVSALIHAATMVTAGVYLIVRTHPIFEAAPTVQLVAAGIGALTLLVAGLVALVQTDIKRVIAYSTMSQIGYMFVGVGLGAYANGMFHLMTHAFFKALLFMTAGLVIHALSGEQDIRNMRGIGQLMPWTRWAFLAGALALVGVPPFAGFFSKDPIVANALASGWEGWFLWVAALAGAFLTGLYTFRLYFVVFPGEPSAFVREHHHAHHGKEGPWTMLVPVGVLAVLSVVGGWIQFVPFWTPVTRWLDTVAPTLASAEPSNWQEGVSSVLAVALGLAGLLLAWLLYAAPERRPSIPRVPSLQQLLEHKFYFDELYDALFYRPAVAFARWSRGDVEEPIVLAAGPDIAETTQEIGRGARLLQTGLLRTYALALAGGLAILAVVFLAVR
jgi:NADH-quinone oxidoreductase subunit L